MGVLGAASLEILSSEGEAEIVAPGGKALALLAYLACSSARSAPRERLAELLWSNSDPESAFQSIRQARATLKRIAGEELVTLNGSTLTLIASVHCDRDEFLSLLTAGQLEAAIEVYRGGFCDGFAASGGDEFERWADVERASLKTRCSEAIARLAAKALSEARATDALALGVQLGLVDADDERHWRIRFEALLLKRDHFGLRIAARDCAAWLTADALEPSRALRQLMDRASRPPNDSGEHVPTSDRGFIRADLVGREAQFGALLAAWKECTRSHASCVAVIGASGFGKTRLLFDLRERLVATGGRVASVRALPAERDVELALLSRIAMALAGQRGAAGLSERSAAVLVGLNPALSVHYPSAAPRFDAVTELTYLEALDELIGVLADESRLALVVDDLHWSDPASSRLLASIAERSTDRRLLLVLATRPIVSSTARIPAAAVRLEVGPLDLPEVEDLLASIARMPDPADGSLWVALQTATDGNPLLILESLRLGMDAGILSIVDGAWRVIDNAALAQIFGRRSALAERVSRLDVASRMTALVLAAAGRPLPVHALVDSLEMSAANAALSLQQLEVRDFAAHVGDGWTIAHDAIADALTTSADATELREVRLRAARGLRALGDASGTASALGMLAAAGAWTEAVEATRTVARLRRTAHGSMRAAAREALGAIADPSARKEVARRLPLTLRYGVPSAYLMTALLGIVVVGLTIARRVTTSPVRETTQMVLSGGPGGRESTRIVDLDLARWSGSGALDTRSLPRERAWPPTGIQYGALGGANGPSAIERTYPDSGGEDVALWYSDGHEERLTSTRGDDVPIGWSPDLSTLLITSSRAGELGHRAIYAVNVRTKVARRVTSGGSREATDDMPAWSPDGSRIAFVRSFYSMRPSELCTVDEDGQREECRAFPGRTVLQNGGWLDPFRVASFMDSAGVKRTEIVTLSDGSLYSPFRQRELCRISLDGAWVACVSDVSTSMLRVAPLSALQAFREVLLPENTNAVRVAWRADTSARHTIENIRLVAPGEVVRVGIGSAFRAEVLTRRNERIENLPLRWSLDDPTAGSVSDNGVVTATRVGSLTVRVSAGGWRSAAIRVRAERSHSAVALLELWDRGYPQRWRFFGQPLPIVVSEGKAKRFWNRGDGDHFSGAYLGSQISTQDGIWLKTDLRTKITATQWQGIQLFLGDLDRNALAKWDHRTGWMPGGSPSFCVFVYPAGEGYLATREVGHTVDVSPHDVELRLGHAVESLSRGGWYTVLLQVFADGRCGLAIDGRPIGIARRQLTLPDSASVIIQGNSVGTRILVGDVTLGRGVNAEVDWSKIQPGAATPPR